jgi:hypothetical protein
LLLDIEVSFLGFCCVDFEKDLIVYKVRDWVSKILLLEHAVNKSEVECFVFEIVIDGILVFANNPRGLFR